MSGSNQPIVCEEIFDETSHPSVDEIIEYASKLGIDTENEPQLLPLAVEGLMKALPPGWKPCYDEKKKGYYYYNNLTGKTQWEHPLDEIYRGIVVKKRAESQSLSIGEPNEDATYTRDDLPSYEEPPKSLEILGVRKKDIKLLPLTKLSPLGKLNDPLYPKLQKQKSEDKVTSAFSLPKGVMHRFNSFDCGDNKNELKISGGGSMFLKCNTKQLDVPMIKDTLSPDSCNYPRGILRERGLENSRSMEFPKSDKSDKDDDDRKSVRFNLEQTPDITFDFSDSSDNEIKDMINETNPVINVITKPKSRFTVSPVHDILKSHAEETKKENNLKLIKPHPKDFIKVSLKSENSDTDEESTTNSADKNDNNKSFDNTELNKGTTMNITKEKREVEKSIENQIEEYRKKLWNEKNEEINKYKHQIEQSHKTEFDRILNSERLVHEQIIKDELDKLRKEMENKQTEILNAEQSKYDEKLKVLVMDLENKFKQDEGELQEKMERDLCERKAQLEGDMSEKIELAERELKNLLEKHTDELTVSHNAILHEIRRKHDNVVEEMKKGFKAEEATIRKEHQAQLAEIRRKTTADVENESIKSKNGDEKLYEKMRCEKRLLEDKYRCLKEKYYRLKADVKLSLEKRNRRREQSITTTGSETERSNSLNKERSPLHSPSSARRNSDKPPTPKHTRHEKPKPENKVTRQLIIQDMDTSMSDHSYNRNDEEQFKNNEDSSDSNTNPGRSRKKLFSRLKSSSATRASSVGKSRKTQRSCSPVENLRRQLQKLEDLEDQFPQNTGTDTYHLRYPFTDDQKFEGSTELEFFRHRIHLERDSIKRAKEGLRSQKNLFQQRQKDLKLKHGTMARHTLQQLCQEEKELTDMEVSLHRTRSLLGEKIIRLRHLEHSLQRASVSDDHGKLEDTTLSDVSSHSASSGISSTEFAMVDAAATRSLFKSENFQESSEIIQSLENLNSEIREIWEVLHKQQQAGNINPSKYVIPPLPLIYPDMGWPVLAGAAPPVPAPPSIPTLADRLHNYRQHVALSNAQSTVVTHATQGATTTLVERTRNLRHWLRQAGMDSANDSNTPQATL